MPVHNKIFVIFMQDDLWAARLLLEEAQSAGLSFSFSGLKVSDMTDANHAACVAKIRASDAVIALLSMNNWKDKNYLWLAKCSCEAAVPLLCVYVDRNKKGPLPQCFKGRPIIDWNWHEVESFLRTL